MSFVSSIKKVLGFPDEYDEDYDAIDESPENISSDNTHDGTPLHPETISNEISVESVMPGEVFDAVIKLFNETQPDFVRQCLNTEAQREYILTHIDTSLKEKLARVTQIAYSEGRRRWEQESNRLKEELANLKEQFETLTRQREEFQSEKLSAARQKRALTERVHDLENKVNELEAQKEQFLLENRSMANKLRIANVRSGGDESTEQEISRLMSEVDRLQAENESHKAEIEQLKASADNETHKAEIEEIQREIEKFESIKKRKDARIAELQNEKKRAVADIDQLNKDLAERNNRISELENDVRELHKTIETNLYAAAETEQKLRDELQSALNQSKAQSVIAPAEPKEEVIDPALPADIDLEPTNPVQQTVRISAIDELMDNTDWFVAPDPIPPKKDPEVEEEFGYKEPVKKPNRDDDKQLSLW